ncbi:GTP-binding protein [Tulasnella sp. JGI-2019a]|nr:GTP-binding protein [Tulasnella sp. JGI-2019a]
MMLARPSPMSYSTSKIPDLEAIEILEFRGSANEDVTAFLGAIKRVAIMHGRHLDYEWLISYTESCLRGDAMRWFYKTDPRTTIKDWSALCRLFLDRFDTPDIHPANPPAPAAAAIRRPNAYEVPKAPLPITVGPEFGRHKAKANDVYKILFIGNSGVGKSCLLSRHLGYGWVSSSTPTVGIHFEVQHLVLRENTFLIKGVYWNISGAEDRNQLGPYYKGINVVWIVYDVTDQKSFQDVRQWFNLVKQYCSTVHTMLLIGNKRDEYDRRVIQEQQGRDLAKELGISKFFETSARTNEGVQQIRGEFVTTLGLYKA